MDWFNVVSIVLNALLTGGLIVTIVTLKAVRRKAMSEADKAAVDVTQSKEDVECTKINNDEKASKVLMEYIVEPLKKELSYMRRDVRQLTRAIERANECDYKEQCPVREEMSKKQEENEN